MSQSDPCVVVVAWQGASSLPTQKITSGPFFGLLRFQKTFKNIYQRVKNAKTFEKVQKPASQPATSKPASQPAAGNWIVKQSLIKSCWKPKLGKYHVVWAEKISKTTTLDSFFARGHLCWLRGVQEEYSDYKHYPAKSRATVEKSRLKLSMNLPTTYYLLPPTTYNRLLTTFYLPPTTYYRLLTTYCLPSTTYHLPPTTCYLLPTAYYHRQPTSY